MESSALTALTVDSISIHYSHTFKLWCFEGSCRPTTGSFPEPLGKMSGYDEHQRLRTKAVRLLAKKNYPAAITLLHDGSVRMLEAKEQGSGCDLGIYMIDVYKESRGESSGWGSR